jgi:hypothetical protein
VQVGEGEFGTVHKAKWYGTIVAVKILRRSDAVAVGDFRYIALSQPELDVTSANLGDCEWHIVFAPILSVSGPQNSCGGPAS